MNFPGAMKAGMAVGLFGGLVAFFAMAFLFNTDDEPLLTMGLCLLIAVLYFALAGGFSKTSQWTQNVLIAYSFITTAAVLGIFIADLIPLWFAVIELVLGILAIAFASLGGSKAYLDNLHKA